MVDREETQVQVSMFAIRDGFYLPACFTRGDRHSIRYQRLNWLPRQ